MWLLYSFVHENRQKEAYQYYFYYYFIIIIIATCLTQKFRNFIWVFQCVCFRHFFCVNFFPWLWNLGRSWRRCRFVYVVVFVCRLLVWLAVCLSVASGIVYMLWFPIVCDECVSHCVELQNGPCARGVWICHFFCACILFHFSSRLVPFPFFPRRLVLLWRFGAKNTFFNTKKIIDSVPRILVFPSVFFFDRVCFCFYSGLSFVSQCFNSNRSNGLRAAASRPSDKIDRSSFVGSSHAWVVAADPQVIRDLCGKVAVRGTKSAKPTGTKPFFWTYRRYQ